VAAGGGSEAWQLTCENPEGTVRSTQNVTIARGQAKTVGVGACLPAPPEGPGPVSEGPGPPVFIPDEREQPGLLARVTASFNGRVYRVTVKGLLNRIEDLDARGGAVGSARCVGKVAVTLTAKRRKIASGKADVDAACGFERSFSVKSSKLPRALRSRRALTSVKAVATYGGGPYLLPATDDASAKVKKKRRR
jgi:hypothetical protein